jgi:hypothetical protein
MLFHHHCRAAHLHLEEAFAFAAHHCLSECTEVEGAQHADRQQDRELKCRRHRQLQHEHEHLGHLGHDESGLLMLERIRSRINVVKSQLRLLQNSGKVGGGGSSAGLLWARVLPLRHESVAYSRGGLLLLTVRDLGGWRSASTARVLLVFSVL